MLLLQQKHYSGALAQFRLLEREAPRSPQGPSGEGITLALMGKPQAAIAALQKALAIEPDYWVARRELGVIYWTQGLKREAAQELEPLIRNHPDDGPVNVILGQYAVEQKNYSLALSYFSRVPSEIAADPRLALAEAEAQLKTGQTARADETLSGLVGRAGLTLEDRFELAWWLGEAKRFKAAIREFETLPPDYPDRFRRNYGLALAYFGDKDYSDCIRALKALAGGGVTRPEVFSLLGVAEEKNGKTKEAYDAFRQGILANPDDPENYLNIATLSCEHLNYGLAIQLLTQGIERMPHSHELFLSRGIAYTLEANFTVAQRDYERAIQLAPGDPVGYLAMGLSQLEAGQLNNAVQSFKEAAVRGPSDPQPYYFLTESLLQRGAAPGSAAYEEAKQAVNTALALDPDFTYAYRDRARLELRAGKTETAIADLERARAADPESASVAYLLARAYLQNGEKAKADVLFNQVKDSRAQEAREFVKNSLTQALVVVSRGNR